VLVAASAQLAGAAEIVMTDLFDEAIAIASRMGASDVVNVRTNEARPMPMCLRLLTSIIGYGWAN
jgi:threonine dehydrogenase-like Zn-dependent dehydrogenase